MITGNFSYTCQSVEEFIRCCNTAYLCRLTATIKAPSEESTMVERGPNEVEYLRRVGKERFRLTKEEKASGATREDIAKARLTSLDLGKPDVEMTEELPPDDNASVF